MGSLRTDNYFKLKSFIDPPLPTAGLLGILGAKASGGNMVQNFLQKKLVSTEYLHPAAILSVFSLSAK